MVEVEERVVPTQKKCQLYTQHSDRLEFVILLGGFNFVNISLKMLVCTYVMLVVNIW